jgi:hypothetical protein
MGRLSDRQELCYTDSADLWSSTIVQNNDGTPNTETWARQAQNVPCKFQMNPNVDANEGAAGRVQRKLIFTMDLIHFGEDVTTGPDWIVKNVSYNEDGTPSQNNGRYWRLLGLARDFNNAGGREMGKRSYMASSEKDPPQGVS